MSDQIIEIDFTGAPPAQGGGRSDRIPPGNYLLEVKDVVHKNSRKNRPMLEVRLVVAQGEYKDKRLADYFTLTPAANGSNYSLQRAHAFLVALGGKQVEGTARIDLSKLTGRQCVGVVGDEEQEATEQYDARTASRVFEYHSVAAWNAQNQNGSTAAPAAQQPTPAPEPTPAPAPAPEPAPAPPQAIAAPAPAPAPEPELAMAAAAADDLFS